MRIESAGAEGFAGGRLRPAAFGGDMETRAVTAEVAALLQAG